MADTRYPDDPSAGQTGTPGSLGPGVPVGLGASSAQPGGSRLPSWVIPMVVLAMVAGLGIGLAVGMLIGGRDDAGQAATTTGAAATSTSAGPTTTVAWEPSDAYGAAVSVTGDALPALRSGSVDAAVGRAMPQITGTDFAGNQLTVGADGRAKLIVGLAHWCPYCNNEVPILNDWYAAGLPAGVDVVAVHVFSDPAKPHFPPAAWVEEVAFSLPLIADDESRTLVTTLGIPAVPFWLLVSADGTVMERGTGQVEAEVLDGIAEALAATVTGG
jgi:cytochrome c biogenesis protein CcmG, thiol:disulfide interchange protein DsbE